MSEYLEKNKLIHPNHHGGRQGHSTATALIQMYDQWVEEVEKGKMVGVMLTDLSLAYDLVNFEILEQKLSLFGTNEQTLSWFSSYLQDRKQSTCVDGKTSPPLPLRQGLPQGSILSPLLYILYTSDVPDIPHSHPVNVSSPATYCQECGSTVSFMDDSTFSIGCESPEELNERLHTIRIQQDIL